jgi:hypothetical protein
VCRESNLDLKAGAGSVATCSDSAICKIILRGRYDDGRHELS